MDSILSKIDKLALFFIGYTITFFLFFGTLSYTLPFVLALICCLIILKPTKYLINKFKMKQSIAALITTFIFFTILIGLLSWGVAALTGEAIQLGKNAQEYIQKNTDTIKAKVDTVEKYYNNLDPTIVSGIENNLEGISTKLSNAAVFIVNKTISTILNILAYVPYIIMVILFTFLCTYFFTKDITSAKNKVLDILPGNKTSKLSYIFNETKKMLGNYLLSYTLIIFITFIETIIIFSILRVKYALLLSVICAIADILPVLGIGAIYIPLALIYLSYGKLVTAIIIGCSWGLVTVIRQIIEPKIVSSSLGIHPVAVLAAIFIGLKASGIAGMFFCIFLVVFYNIMKKVDVL